MKRTFKLLTVFTLVLISLTIITGCGKKKESTKKEEVKSVFTVEQSDSSTVQVKLENAKKGEKQSATITVAEGQKLVYDFNITNKKTVNVALCSSTATSEKDFLTLDELNDKGTTTVYDMSGGEYKIFFVVKKDKASGTITISAK